jgi:hypothetical protein
LNNARHDEEEREDSKQLQAQATQEHVDTNVFGVSSPMPGRRNARPGSLDQKRKDVNPDKYLGNAGCAEFEDTLVRWRQDRQHDAPDEKVVGSGDEERRNDNQ